MGKKQTALIKNAMTPVAEVPLRLNLGSGPTKMDGFLSVDSIAFPGVDVVCDLNGKWPWKDNSVDSAHASHVIEHFDGMERVHFMNELYRVLKPDGECMIAVPHWCSCRAYGDPSHKWPPVSEFWFYYLSRKWRMGDPETGTGANAPHTDASLIEGGFDCDFEARWGYSLHQAVAVRNQEYQQHAMQFFKEACLDTICTVVAKK